VVIFFSDLLSKLSNRTIGPLLNNIKIVLPQLLHQDDSLAQGVLKKYQKLFNSQPLEA